MEQIKLLIANDTDHTGHIYKQAFEGLGFSVSLCPKTSQGIEAALEEDMPQVVLCSAFLGESDACTVIEETNDKYGELAPAFVCMMPCESEPVRQLLLTCGCAYVCAKPIHFETLGRRICALTRQKSGQSPKIATYTHTDLEVYITETLHQIGVPAHIKGYHYIRDAILMSIDDPQVLGSVTKIMYPGVAKIHGTSPSRVERAIRHAIEVAWDRGDVDVLNRYFGYTVNSLRGKPTNSEFIAMLTDKMKLAMKRGTLPVDDDLAV